ncbi:MAG: molybdate ABC transporter substrate-binding protein [Acidaminobacteraceae bacterium]
MKKQIIALIFILTLVSLTGCSNNDSLNSKTITIAAAASLTNPINKIIENFEVENPDYDIVVSFASSGSLLKQIEEGAPIDIFLSASTSKFDSLLGKKISVENSKILLSNSMTLITYKDKVFSNSEEEAGFNDFTNYIYSIGDPESVPAGRYAYEILKSLDLWTASNEKQITAKSVRQVLNYVESHNVDYGIVYSSDAFNNGKIKILKDFDKSTHSAINYPIGILDESLNNETKVLYNYIISDKAMDVFLEYGFKQLDN